MRMGQGVRTGLGHGGITCVLQTQFSSLPYDAVITLCHQNSMTICVIIFSSIHVAPLTTTVSTILFLIDVLTLKEIKSHLNGSYDKYNIILLDISYEIYETRQRLFHKFHMK